MSNKIKILIADRHEMMRDVLVNALKKTSDIEVAFHTSSGRDAIDAMKQFDIDIILLGEELAEVPCLEALRKIVNRFPTTKTIVISNRTEIDVRMVKHYMDAGAASYLYTTNRYDVLLEAIREVKDKGFYMESSVSRLIFEGLVKDKRNPLEDVTFGGREHEVFIMVCNGMSNKQIAARLDISASAIDYYKSKIYEKTRCRNKNKLTIFALKNKMITLSDLNYEEC